MLKYIDGQLYFGSSDKPISLSGIAQKSDRPVYVYDLHHIQRRFTMLKEALPQDSQVHYAVKANSNKEVLATLNSMGCGADVVSGGEVELCVEAGFSPKLIIFSGVAKTKKEIRLSLNYGIGQFNVESLPELIRIGEIAREMNKQAPVAFRLNPNIDAKSHPYISTGLRENKFGLEVELLPQLKEVLNSFQDSLTLKGLSVHVGSQIFSFEVLKESWCFLVEMYDQLTGEGYSLEILDAGGGIGVRYEQSDESEEEELLRKYAEMLADTRKNRKVKIQCEPGRIIVGRAGVLLSQVQYIKKGLEKNFLIVDTGMHHLMRPALYQARHRIMPVIESSAPKTLYDVVGPICESADFVGKDIELPEMKADDWIAIADTGAYGFVMANNYNAHELPQELVF